MFATFLVFGFGCFDCCGILVLLLFGRGSGLMGWVLGALRLANTGSRR